MHTDISTLLAFKTYLPGTVTMTHTTAISVTEFSRADPKRVSSMFAKHAKARLTSNTIRELAETGGVHP
jgi:hypothetical protein